VGQSAVSASTKDAQAGGVAATSGVDGANLDANNVTAKTFAAAATNSTDTLLVANPSAASTNGPAAAHSSEPITPDSRANSAAQVEKHAEAAAAYPDTLFQSAKLVERLGQSELRVGIQAGEFGNVDIRTSMAHNQFTAQISVERTELSKALVAELPSLQNRLSDQHLPNSNIILQNPSNSGSPSFGQGSRESQTTQQSAVPHSSKDELAPAFMGPAEANLSTERLDVHA